MHVRYRLYHPFRRHLQRAVRSRGRSPSWTTTLTLTGPWRLYLELLDELPPLRIV